MKEYTSKNGQIILEIMDFNLGSILLIGVFYKNIGFYNTNVGLRTISIMILGFQINIIYSL